MEQIIVGFIIGVALFISFVIGRASGRKSLLPLVEALQNPPFVPPEQPQYKTYLRTQGVFLGRFRSTIGEGYNYDLYYNNEVPKAVTARHGENNIDFIMALCTESEDDNPEALAEALRRARDSGL